jgi:hypothetical protein
MHSPLHGCSILRPPSMAWQHVFPQMINAGPMQQSSSPQALAKHRPGQHSSRRPQGRFSPGSHGLAAVGLVVAPRSAAASSARHVVRRDPDARKRRVSRSKVWLSMGSILSDRERWRLAATARAAAIAGCGADTLSIGRHEHMSRVWPLPGDGPKGVRRRTRAVGRWRASACEAV